jgi:hypothetical protein
MLKKNALAPLALPTGGTGLWPGTEARDAYDARVKAWCDAFLEIRKTLDFDPGVRGWCYIAEVEGGLIKGDFDKAEKLIGNCRKKGLLPLDFCSEEEAREFSNIEKIDDDPETDAQQWINTLADAHERYNPVSFWDNQASYVQMLVEKIGLHSLFEKVCAKYRVPIGNAKGSSSQWQRVRILERFAEKQMEGKRCVLLYCGDHDPPGMMMADTLHKNLADMVPAFQREFPHLTIDLDAVEVTRFGLDADFIDEQGFSWTHNLITGGDKDLGDPKHKQHKRKYVQDYIKKHGKKKLESDVLVTKPVIGRRLCEDAILPHINRAKMKQWQTKRDALRMDMKLHLHRMLKAWT